MRSTLALFVALFVGLPLRIFTLDSVHTRLKSWHTIARDIGTDKTTTHHYETVYERNLASFRVHPIRLLEIGLGCNMGYGPGRSWTVWNEYFVHKDARISFVEVDRPCAEKWGGNITRGDLYIGSQDDPAVLQEIVSKNSATGFDIIIDDGGHTMKQHQDAFNMLWPLIKPGGLYFIEDLETAFDVNYASVGYNSTTDVIKGFMDNLTACGYRDVVCPEYVRIECARNVCLLQRAF